MEPPSQCSESLCLLRVREGALSDHASIEQNFWDEGELHEPLQKQATLVCLTGGALSRAPPHEIPVDSTLLALVVQVAPELLESALWKHPLQLWPAHTLVVGHEGFEPLSLFCRPPSIAVRSF